MGVTAPWLVQLQLTIIIMLRGAVVLVMGMVSMGQVMTTKTVKAERVVETMTDSVTRGMGVGVEVDQTWHLTEEFKAIMGGVLGFWGGVGSMGTVFLLILLTQRCCCIVGGGPARMRQVEAMQHNKN